MQEEKTFVERIERTMSASIDRILNNVFDNLKKCTPALVTLLLGTAFLVFAPEKLLRKLHLYTIPESIMSVIGLAFLISLVLVVVIATTKLFKRISRWRSIAECKKQLNKLSDEEKMIIVLMYNQPYHILSMSESSGIAGVMRSKCIIGMASNISDGVGYLTFKYVLQPWVVKYLDKHPNFFPMTEQEIEQVYTAYMKSIRL